MQQQERMWGRPKVLAFSQALAFLSSFFLLETVNRFVTTDLKKTPWAGIGYDSWLQVQVKGVKNVGLIGYTV